MQKQPSKGFFKKGVMRNFVEFTRKHVPESLFLIKLNSAASLKTRHQRRIFLVDFAKFVRTPFLQNTTRKLLLIIAVSIVLVMKGELAKTIYQFEPKCTYQEVHSRCNNRFQKRSFVGFKKFFKLHRKTSVFESLGLQLY